MDALLYARMSALSDAEQFNPVAELSRRFEIGGRNRFDPFDGDRGWIDDCAKGERGENGKLMRGIVAADVKGRIGFRISQPLGLLQAFAEGELFRFHPRQDVIAGAIQYAVDALNRIAGKPLPQRLDNRNAARHRRFERKRDAFLPGEEASATQSSNQANCARSTPRSFSFREAETPVITIWRPVRPCRASACLPRSLITAAPTVPRPAMPMRRGEGMEGKPAELAGSRNIRERQGACARFSRLDQGRGKEPGTAGQRALR